MRRIILLFVLLIAICAGGYAFFSEQKPKEEVVSVLFATKDIFSGKFISAESVEVRQVRASEQRELSKKFGILVPVSAQKDLQNFVPRSPIAKGEAISEKKLIRPSDPDFLPAVLEQGQRAVTIRLNDVASGIGLYRPGNYIDVILTYLDSSSGNNQKRVAVTLFRGLRILALGGDLGLSKSQKEEKSDKKISSVVTLEASPRQAEALVLAGKLGELSLSLRANEGKDAVSEPTRTSVGDVIQTQEQSASSSGKQSQGPVKIRGLYGDKQQTITLE